MEQIGKWLLPAGLLLAVIAGIITSLGEQAWVAIVLVILGLLIGIMKEDDGNKTGFLVGGLALIATQESLGAILAIGDTLNAIFGNVVVLIMPVMLVVVVKAMMAMGMAKE